MTDSAEPTRPLPTTSSPDLHHADEAVYLRIKRIASRFVRLRVNPTLTPTAVANEVWIRLRKSKSRLVVRDEAHFDALVGRTTRFVADDSARRRLSNKRRGEWAPLTDAESQTARQASLETILAVKEGLDQLDVEDHLTAQIVHDRFYEGLTVAEISAKREIPQRTIERTLALGTAWLHNWLTRSATGEAVPHER